MKRVLFILATIFILLSSQSVAQKESKVYRAIILTTTSNKIDGILQEARDTSLIILSNLQVMEISSATIKTITIKRVGAVGRNALKIGLIGTAVGAIGGFASGDDDPGILSWTAEEKALGFGIIGGITGGLIGLVTGLIPTESIAIHGDPKIYQSNLEVLRKYVLKSNE